MNRHDQDSYHANRNLIAGFYAWSIRAGLWAMALGMLLAMIFIGISLFEPSPADKVVMGKCSQIMIADPTNPKRKISDPAHKSCEMIHTGFNGTRSVTHEKVPMTDWQWAERQGQG